MVTCPEGQVNGRSAWKPAGHRPVPGRTNPRGLYLFPGKLADIDGKPVGATRTADEWAVHYGIMAIQKSINSQGYRHPVLGPIPVTGLFGPRTQWGVQWLQKARGLKVDGVFGPLTARALFVPLVKFYCSGIMGGIVVPFHHICGMFDLESGWDPAAVSTCYKPENGPDRGLAQINEAANLSISEKDTFDPFVSIPYAVHRLHAGRLRFDDKGPELQTNCSIAQHNNPAAARLWYEIGWMGEDEPIRIYVDRVLDRAEEYV